MKKLCLPTGVLLLCGGALSAEDQPIPKQLIIWGFAGYISVSRIAPPFHRTIALRYRILPSAWGICFSPVGKFPVYQYALVRCFLFGAGT